ncbi:MAG TPA: glycosyltransferase family 2 protein [Flavisolibacter sp.]
MNRQNGPSVAIVILNWNGRHFLEQFLPAVLTTSYPGVRVVVADNASTDDSVELLRTGFPQVERVALPANYGFARGYNEALRSVQADYYALLNSDVEVTAGWLEPIIDLLEQDKRNAACQPKIRSFNRPDHFEYAGAAGGWIDAFGYPFSRGRIFDTVEKDSGSYDEPRQIFWASGAAFVVKSNVYHELGGFDNFFFAHQEEIDLCWRMQLEGYRVFCQPRSIVYHVGGGMLPQGNARKTFLNFRNNMIMLAKNLTWSELWWKIPFRMGLDQVSAVRSLLSGNGRTFRAVIRGHLAFISWMFSKHAVRARGSRPLANLEGVYRGNIAWQYFVRKRRTFRELFGS